MAKYFEAEIKCAHPLPPCVAIKNQHKNLVPSLSTDLTFPGLCWDLLIKMQNY